METHCKYINADSRCLYVSIIGIYICVCVCANIVFMYTQARAVDKIYLLKITKI